MLSKKKLAKDYGNVQWYGKKCHLGSQRLSATHYIVTEDRLYSRTGVLSTDEERIELFKITDFSLKISFGNRIFGCGSIVIMSKDVTSPTFVIENIKSPREAMRIIEGLVDTARSKYHVILST